MKRVFEANNLDAGAKCLQYNMVRIERDTFHKLQQLKKRRRCRSMNALILKLMEAKK